MRAQNSLSPAANIVMTIGNIMVNDITSNLSSKKNAEFSQQLQELKSKPLEQSQLKFHSKSNNRPPAKTPTKHKIKPCSQSPSSVKHRQIQKFSVETSNSQTIQLTGSNPPKMYKSSFMFFLNEKREAVMEENQTLRCADNAKFMGQAWNQLDETQKEPYKKLSAADMIRYLKEMKQFKEQGFYINQNGENSKTFYIPKLPKDIVKPKKLLGPYMFFNLEQIQILRAANPSLKPTDIAKQTGKDWNTLSKKDRDKYYILADQDRMRYQKEMDQLISQGFFVNKNGIKSTDKKTRKKPVSKSPGPWIQMQDLNLSDENQNNKRFQLIGSNPPKKWTQAYFYFWNEKREAVMNQDPNLQVGACAKLVSEAWSLLDETQKQPFFKMQAADKIRYQKELAQFIEKGYFINEKGQNSKNLFKPKLTDDIVKPKRPMPVFKIFSIIQGKKLRAASQSLKHLDFYSQTGKDWNALAEKDREEYYILAEQDKLRYKKEMDQLMSQGYFVNKDGIKSTDINSKNNPDSQSSSNSLTNIPKSPILQVTGSSLPKRVTTSFLFYLNENRESVMKKNPKFSYYDCLRYFGKAWGQLNETQKQPYNQLAAADQIRYKKEKSQFKEQGFFINDKGENSKNLYKPKLTNDIVKPKKTSSAFMIYNLEQTQKLRVANPSVRITDFSKFNSKNWNALAEKDKNKYYLLADQDKVRYQKEMDQLLSQGFFINKDGIKSTDKKVKRKLKNSGSKIKAQVEDLVIKNGSTKVKKSD